MEALRQLYEENRLFLKPLLVDYHSSSFSKAYRQILKDGLRRDSGFPSYPEGSKEFFAVDCVMSGFIEQLIQCLDKDQLTMLESFRLAHGMMVEGTVETLRKMFGIHSAAPRDE